MLTRVYLCLPLVYSFTYVYHSLLLLDYLGLPMFTRVCLCLIVYIYLCLTRLNLGNIVKQARLNSAKRR